MKKLTCILLSFLLFATPLFAVKYINIYNKKGKKIGYVENEKGQLIYYDINNNKKGALVNYDFYGNKTGEIYLDYYYEKEIKRIRRSKFVAASSFLTFVWSANMEWIDSNNISTYSAISEVTSIALLISGAMYIYYYLTTPKKTSSTKYKIVNYNYKIPNKQKNEPNYEMWQ